MIFDAGTLWLGAWGGVSAAIVIVAAACRNACSLKCCFFKKGCGKH